MNALNFLKLPPQTTWFDYFFERSKFFDLIENADKNEVTVGQLLDQFIEQAMEAEREQAQLEAKQMDEDDIIYMRHKVAELWMCATCLLAALSWDVDRLTKYSNVQRIRALLNKLCCWIAGNLVVKRELDKTSDAFAKIVVSNEVHAFNSEQIFVLWTYARWILLIDVRARFPQPPPKPTVSNPLNQPDQALIQAEKLRLITEEIRVNVPTAVKLLDQFLNVSNWKALKAYGHECFHVQLETMTTTKIDALKEKEPHPNFDASCQEMSQLGFQNKTRLSLLIAHFAARHFRNAKLHLEKIAANLENLRPEGSEFLQKLLHVDSSTFKSYTSALNFQKGTAFKVHEFKRANEPDAIQARCTIDAAVQRHSLSPKMLLHVLMDGGCISKRYLGLLSDPNFSAEFLEEVAKQFWSLTFVLGAKDRDNARRLHVYCALYFFCLISPGFADALLAHPRLRSLGKWRGLATTVETQLAKQPRNDELTSFLSNETPLWNVMVSFNLEVIKNNLNRLHNNFRLPYKHRFSEVIAEKLLSRAGRHYNQVVLHLWKLEQLVSLNNIVKWKEFVNGMVTTVMQQMFMPEDHELLAYDLIRVQTDMLNRQLMKTENGSEFKLANADHFKLVSCSMQMALPKQSLVFTRFSLPLSVFLLNNRHYQVIALSEHPCLKTPFMDLARNLAVYFLCMFEMRDLNGAKNHLLNFWTTIWPTFEPANANRRPIIQHKQFMEFITNLKEPNVLDFFFSFLSYLINMSLALVESERDKSVAISPLLTAILTNRRINAPSESIWHHMTFDPKTLDIDFTKRVLDVFCQNAMTVSAINIHWLRICGDFQFLCENYHRAITYYLEILVAIENNLGVIEIGDMDLDQILMKISVACAVLHMPTLAVIVGQLRRNMAAHYPNVEWMLQNTPNTVDAGYAYFPLIADITLVEYMTSAYNKFGLTLYTQKLLKVMPTKAINANNSPKVLASEVARRKNRFLGVLLNQFFRN